jgi:hypothetical protein
MPRDFQHRSQDERLSLAEQIYTGVARWSGKRDHGSLSYPRSIRSV